MSEWVSVTFEGKKYKKKIARPDWKKMCFCGADCVCRCECKPLGKKIKKVDYVG